MAGKKKDPNRTYNPNWGKLATGQGPHCKRRTLTAGNVETFKVYRPGSDEPLMLGWGEISVGAKTRVTTITTAEGWRIVIGDAL